MTSDATPPTIRLVRFLSAPPEEVFDAWADPAGQLSSIVICCWMRIDIMGTRPKQ